MRERVIEKKLRIAIEQLGGTCEKFVSPGKRGVPDRLCSLRNGKLFFVETKAPRKGPTAAQKRDHARRRARGFNVYVVANEHQIASVIYMEHTLS